MNRKLSIPVTPLAILLVVVAFGFALVVQIIDSYARGDQWRDAHNSCCQPEDFR